MVDDDHEDVGDDVDHNDDDDVVPTRVMYEWSECIWIASQPPLPNTIEWLTHQPAHDDYHHDDDDDDHDDDHHHHDDDNDDVKLN